MIIIFETIQCICLANYCYINISTSLLDWSSSGSARDWLQGAILARPRQLWGERKLLLVIPKPFTSLYHAKQHDITYIIFLSYQLLFFVTIILSQQSFPLSFHPLFLHSFPLFSPSSTGSPRRSNKSPYPTIPSTSHSIPMRPRLSSRARASPTSAIVWLPRWAYWSIARRAMHLRPVETTTPPTRGSR